MAFTRKCISGVKMLKTFNKLSPVLLNNSRIKNIYSHRNFNCNSRISWRSLHTSSILNKVVAFKLSDIGEGIREVVVKEWFIKEGDKVQQFDNICEVQSDKAAVTITSRYDGIVTRLYHKVDETALVGQPLVDIDLGDSGNDESSTADKAPEKIEDDNVKNEVASSSRVKFLTTPAVRRIASQFNVDLSTVNATGRNGRILKEDLLSHLNITSDKSNDVSDIKPSSSEPTISIPKTEVLLEDKTVPVTGFTKAMIKSMTEAMKIPHFGFSDEYDVTKLVESRESLKTLAQKHGVKLTYMPIIIKAASQSLLSFPILNSSLDSACENLVYKSSHNIGVAMDTPNGLVVPVIKNVQAKSILTIAKELNLLQEKGSKGQLGLSDISGGTFTLSNIGIVGGTYTKPVILPPQVSIGALGKIQEEAILLMARDSRGHTIDVEGASVSYDLDVLPRFDAEGNVVKSHILTVSWSADHRVIDGVTMARFSNQLKEYLENPYKLLLDL